MQICQNPHCPNPFNSSGDRFCTSCGNNKFSPLFRNRYRVKKVLGEGGFGRTYKAEDADRLDDPCVIKQFIPQVQGKTALVKAAAMFQQEAVRLYELGENHPQIPRLLAYFEQGNCLYLVQEFIPGKTLLQEAVQAFSETQIRALLANLLPVIQFIHQRQVIHRDIKPENIIRHDEGGNLVLIDFGGAKQVTQTSFGRQATGIYTIGYAPIEQMAGFACNQSDLYGLGVTCARLLTQCFPIQNDYGEIQDRLYDPLNAQWLWREYLQEKDLTISSELAQILDKLLQHLPKDRYQSATEVLQDLNLKPLRTPLATPQPPQTTLHTFKFTVVTVDARGQVISRNQNQAQYFIENLESTTLEMVAIPSGTFMMGSPEETRFDAEQPQHQVSIQPFFMGKYPITQAQWQAVAALPKIKKTLQSHNSKFESANRPVENISWHDAIEFCARLSKKTGRNYRLPNEAEWEYACRAYTTTQFHFGETITTNLANYDGTYQSSNISKSKRQETTPVGSFQVANAFGLYDMHGLVWEWCADSWHENYHGAPKNGIWTVGGDDKYRVLRGGAWDFNGVDCRSAARVRFDPDLRSSHFGFRVVV